MALRRPSRKVVPLKAGDYGMRTAQGTDMAGPNGDHVYRVIEIVGTSQNSIEDAIKSGVERASSTLRHVRWFEVVRTSGHVDDGMVHHYQVTMKVGFTMENA